MDRFICEELEQGREGKCGKGGLERCKVERGREGEGSSRCL